MLNAIVIGGCLEHFLDVHCKITLMITILQTSASALSSHWKKTVILWFFSVLLCLPLLSNAGRPTTFDGHIHITTMQMFADSLRAGELPAWSQGFGNYGYPLALIAHQLPAYSGASLILLGVYPESAFKFLILLTTMVSSLGMFLLIKTMLQRVNLNEQNSGSGALFGSLFWLFSSYRIMNVYSRGALPELFAAAIIPFLILTLYLFVRDHKSKHLLFTSVLSFLLTICHPMMLLISGPLLLGAVLMGSYKSKKSTITLPLVAATSVILGVLMGSYYILPLVAELKYFYQGAGIKSVGVESFISWQNIPIWNWPFFSASDHPGPRNGLIQVGIIETAALCTGVLSYFFDRKLRKNTIGRYLIVWVSIAVGTLALSSVYSKPLFDSLPILASLQFPWRFLLAFQFTTAVIAALLLARYRIHSSVFLLLVAAIIFVRLPEAYGKNFVHLPTSDYQFNVENLHTVNMNPVWVGDTKEYPIKHDLFSVVEGSTQILASKEKPSVRTYSVDVATESRISFNTFYFPGWQLLIDGNAADLEYQDPQYRGVMTTRLAAGTRQVSLIYSDTKIRTYAKYLSVLAAAASLIFPLIYSKWINQK